jgi:hypothetical protein
MKDRVQKIYSNHDDVLAFGIRSLKKYLPVLTERCPYYSDTTISNVRMGIEIINRLGSYDDVSEAIKFIDSTLNDLEQHDLNEWQLKQINNVRLFTADYLMESPVFCEL